MARSEHKLKTNHCSYVDDRPDRKGSKIVLTRAKWGLTRLRSRKKYEEKTN